MIAVDTSSLIAFLKGEQSKEMDEITSAIAEARIALPPAVLTEALSDPLANHATAIFLMGMPLLEIKEGYWVRAARIRQNVLMHGLKAHFADALVAQSCIDHDVPLITSDKDFRHYAKHCGLELYA